jgi:hypothetical protein
MDCPGTNVSSFSWAKKTTGHDPSEEQQQKDLHETG